MSKILSLFLACSSNRFDRIQDEVFTDLFKDLPKEQVRSIPERPEISLDPSLC